MNKKQAAKELAAQKRAGWNITKHGLISTGKPGNYRLEITRSKWSETRKCYIEESILI